MAQQVHVALVDDLDGSQADHTVEFGLGGKQFEIDLSDDHAQHLRRLLEPFVDAARKPGSKTSGNGRAQRTRIKHRPNREENAAIRAWARKKRIKLSDRGRIPNQVIAKYREAQAS